MTFVKLIFFMIFAVVANLSLNGDAFAASMAEQAASLASIRAKEADIEKDFPKTGEMIPVLEDLTIDMFLEMDAVPDGLGATEADLLHSRDTTLYDRDFMTDEQAESALKRMREQGINLPQNLEEEIKKNPEQRSKLLADAFDNITPSKIDTKEDIDKIRRDAIRRAEQTLGIDFRSIMEHHKRLMTPKNDQ